MRIKNLPEEAKEELDSAFRASKSVKEQKRIQIIRLLGKGYKHKAVSEITGRSEAEIRKLVSIYNRDGIQGLFLKPHPRNNSRLTIKQKDKIKEILTVNEYPSEAGLKVCEDEDFWSLRTLKQLVKKLYRVDYRCKSTYQRLFKYCGYSYQKVEFQDERRSDQEADGFKKRFDMKLKKGAMSMWW